MSTEQPNVTREVGALKRLVASLPPVRPTPWREYADLIAGGGVEEADARGFVVHGSHGRRRVDVPGGLTEPVYNALAPLVTDEERAALAWGVLDNILRLDWADWTAGTTLLRKEYGDDEAAWLPPMVTAGGFAAVAAEMRGRLAGHRRHNPRPDFRLAVAGRPTWMRSARVLAFGPHRWHFREDAEVILKLLDLLAASDWRPVFLSDTGQQGVPGKYLDPEQVRDAAKALRKRTLPHIDWHAANDGTFSWSVR